MPNPVPNHHPTLTPMIVLAHSESLTLARRLQNCRKSRGRLDSFRDFEATGEMESCVLPALFVYAPPKSALSLGLTVQPDV
jgi:hypothetical protein